MTGLHARDAGNLRPRSVSEIRRRASGLGAEGSKTSGKEARGGGGDMDWRIKLDCRRRVTAFSRRGEGEMRSGGGRGKVEARQRRRRRRPTEELGI